MLPKPIEHLIRELNRLPGIGPKTAERLTFYLLKQGRERAGLLAQALSDLHQAMGYCQRCCNISERTLCRICDNPGRNQRMVCVVEEVVDVMAVENIGVYKGVYHVLQGAISPADGIGPEHLTIHQLMKRADEEALEEIIVATNPTVTGQATSGYIAELLKPRKVRVTHLALGLPIGGQLEFADPDTLRRAMSGRREDG